MTATNSELRRCQAAALELADMLADTERELVALRTAVRAHRRAKISNQELHGADLNLWRILDRVDTP